VVEEWIYKRSTECYGNLGKNALYKRVNVAGLGQLIPGKVRLALIFHKGSNHAKLRMAHCTQTTWTNNAVYY
jgi:hypothetical protein